MRRQSGFGLVEILIAMTLGLVLGAAIINVYLESRRNYQFDEEMARMQEGGRYSLALFKRELSLAGYLGGLLDRSKLTAQAVTTDCAATNWAMDIDAVVDTVNSFNGSAASVTTQRSVVLTCLDAGEVQDGSDVVVVKRTAGDYTLNDGSLNTAAENDNQWYLRVADRSNFSWAYLGASGEIPAADKTAGSGIDYWQYYTNILYVRNYSNAVGDGIPTLCIESLTNNAMVTNAYVEGVEDVQLEVGIDADDDGFPEIFRAPASAADLDDAVAWRVYILMRSVNTINGYTNEKAFKLGQKTVAAKNDSYLRQVYTTTIEMQNTKLGI